MSGGGQAALTPPRGRCSCAQDLPVPLARPYRFRRRASGAFLHPSPLPPPMGPLMRSLAPLRFALPLAGLALLLASPAAAQDVPLARLVAEHSGKCLSVVGQSTG